MEQTIHLLVREHRTDYKDIETKAKKVAEDIVSDFFKFTVAPARIMNNDVAGIFAQRVVETAMDMLDAVLEIVHRALKEPFERILINFQHLMALFKSHKKKLHSKVLLPGYP